MRPLTSGDRIGPYLLEERLGRGGFGEVWRARHSALKDKVVAVKIPTDAAYTEVLRREGILQHRLTHRSIVKLLDLDTDHDPPYLVMEYVEGESLRDRIARESPMPAAQVLSLARAILNALHVAHQAGAIHRDLKPENVLLPKQGGVKLADFGLGKALDESRSILLRSQTMRTGEIATIAGTLSYMSPEQRSGKGPVDYRADIFAFGVLFFEMLTGELPAGTASPSDLVEDVDPKLDDIYRKCCAPMSTRYASARDVFKVLAAALDGKSPAEVVAAGASHSDTRRGMPDESAGGDTAEMELKSKEEEGLEFGSFLGIVLLGLGCIFAVIAYVILFLPQGTSSESGATPPPVSHGEWMEQKREREREAERVRLQEQANWIQQHGSEHLRRLHAGEYDLGGLYEEERLALERPGWKYRSSIPAGNWLQPTAPSEQELDLLEEAKKTDPNARLLLYKGPSGRIAHIVVAKFLGDEIVLDRPQESH